MTTRPPISLSSKQTRAVLLAFAKHSQRVAGSLLSRSFFHVMQDLARDLELGEDNVLEMAREVTAQANFTLGKIDGSDSSPKPRQDLDPDYLDGYESGRRLNDVAGAAGKGGAN